jgi:hypothetical protein
MTQRRVTTHRLDQRSPELERRERPARDARRRTEQARREMEFLAAGPAGYAFLRRP